ncbi:iron uptake transporter deferrochelatase/peroxidase subunit [Kineococcus rubinsiae]|uniref:iron uptake transporter deferrochelatase/peroxidase subunit n=1 Tax=Kineococcus rubinsiae TaxID=2609562 RepID=UPI001430C3A2|nr:iron uptake transporter deferrochelatase/peroxidase subunit [Kineococcus rubinsiae]NIZ91025.1 deferrochelatase/peroxidase EfeB [Kineococcus rubinsiae]
MSGVRPTRRGVLTGAAVVGAAGIGAGSVAFAGRSPESTANAATRTVAFHGARQAGITTPAQDQLVFAAIDVTTTDASALADVLARWTEATRAMTTGAHVGGPDGIGTDPDEPAADTGEAYELHAANLTVTLGYGPSLFDGRFGLQDKRPAALQELPPLPGEQLDPTRCGGDLCLQACADDPQVAFHAVRNLLRIGRGVVAVRWMQLGFGRTASTAAGQATPRNLFGFKDGTANVRAEDTTDLDAGIFVGGPGSPAVDQEWMRDGTYLVARRIRMLIESWDRATLGEQERVVGRTKKTGAPLTGSEEFDPLDLDRTAPSGEPVIDVKAHVRLAAPETNGGAKLLRRGYSYTDGLDPVTGQLDAGLFFIAFQNDPESQFVAIQRRLGAHDAMTEYVKHVGSAVFACPPGVGPDGSWGDGLFT